MRPSSSTLLILLLVVVGCGHTLREDRLAMLEVLYEHASKVGVSLDRVTELSMEAISSESGLASSRVQFLCQTLDNLDYISWHTAGYIIRPKGIEYFEDEHSKDQETLIEILYFGVTPLAGVLLGWLLSRAQKR